MNISIICNLSMFVTVLLFTVLKKPDNNMYTRKEYNITVIIWAFYGIIMGLLIGCII